MTNYFILGLRSYGDKAKLWDEVGALAELMQNVMLISAWTVEIPECLAG